MNKNLKNQGLIKTFLILVILVLVLSFFNIDIRTVAESEQSQKNISYITEVVNKVWERYLSEPVTYFWNNIFINLLWNSFAENMDRIKTGQPHTFDLLAPTVPNTVPNPQ